jgi:hypothetical protein
MLDLPTDLRRSDLDHPARALAPALALSLALRYPQIHSPLTNDRTSCMIQQLADHYT